MGQADTIEKTRAYLEDTFKTSEGAHDYWHMYRVWRLAQNIAKTEPTADRYVVELAALLHDIADWKFNDGNLEAGPRAARTWLESIGVDDKIIHHIEEIIRTTSFKGAGVPSESKTIEAQIVHDADKLDAIGAIGIARTFAYGGAKQLPIYDPAVKPTLHADFESYKNSRSPTINHFYEKLLLLKDRFYTNEAKRIAEHRHSFMEAYLEEFFSEIDGKL